MNARTAIPWRDRPLLRVGEVAGLCGDIDERSLESHVIHHVEVRMIGRIRFVTTESFRRWLGFLDGPAVRLEEVGNGES